MKVQGRDCTLTLLKDNEYYPLPYSEETVRQASKGYALPGSIGVITGRSIQRCVVTRLEEAIVLALFLLLFYREEKFDLLADRVAYKVIYKNFGIKEFELRGENKAPLYLRLDVEENADSYTTDWDITPPSLKWNQSRTFYFDGHSVIADLKTLPLVYHFELTGKYTEKAKYNITLYFPFTDEYFPT